MRGHGSRVLLVALAGGAPAVLLSAFLVTRGEHDAKRVITVLLAALVPWLLGAAWLRAEVLRPLHTAQNLLAALREGDFGLRARRAPRRGAAPPDPPGGLGSGAADDDAVQLLYAEIDAFADVLRDERLSSREATALLTRVMDEIDDAVLAFDEGARLVLVNPAGERLLGAPRERTMGLPASELALGELLTGETPRRISRDVAGTRRRLLLRTHPFRQGGRPHVLVVLSDVGRVLRDEEREAQRSLVRVLGHEINNSLSPIRSLAQSLHTMVERSAEKDPDVLSGLDVIARRAEALSRFLSAYGTLARLPPPTPGEVDVGELVRRACRLSPGVSLQDGPPCVIDGDADQLEQALINLVKNAIEASASASVADRAPVRVTWATDGAAVEIRVVDDGPGIAAGQNLFVPFFSTKPGGSGIGLVLAREIVEAHGGTLSLANTRDGRGAVATVRLPRTRA